VLARSHVVLATAPYLALLSHPLGAPALLPVLGLPPGETASDPVVLIALSVGVVAAAALAPDIDHARGTVGRAAGAPGRLAAGTVSRLLKHRGPLHSALAAAVAGVVAELLGERFGVTGLGALVAFGWASHILADALTDRGVPLLWPLWRKRLRLPFGLGIATGSGAEAAIVVAGILLCAAWIALGLYGSLTGTMGRV
jgi:inner membrane protein